MGFLLFIYMRCFFFNIVVFKIQLKPFSIKILCLKRGRRCWGTRKGCVVCCLLSVVCSLFPVLDQRNALKAGKAAFEAATSKRGVRNFNFSHLAEQKGKSSVNISGRKRSGRSERYLWTIVTQGDELQAKRL